MYKFGQNFYTSIGKYWTFIFFGEGVILRLGINKVGQVGQVGQVGVRAAPAIEGRLGGVDIYTSVMGCLFFA